MGHALQLLRLVAEGEEVLDVDAGRAVVGPLVLGLLARTQLVALDAQRLVPAQPHVAPILIPLLRFVGMAEELDLHLLELARAEGVVARVDLVAKSLTDLGNAERHLHPRRVHHVLEVGKNTLGGLGTEIGHVRSILQCTNIRLKHQVECTRFCERTMTPQFGD
jgi:hypothetical protein